MKIENDRLKTTLMILTQKLKLKEDEKDFATEVRVEAVIKRYSNFVQFPIELNEKQVNTVGALWTKNKSEITDEEYQAAFKSHSLGDLMNASREGS